MTVGVSIAVTSVNEHAPVFTSSSYSHDVKEDTVIGTSLLRVTAEDNDNGPQGKALGYYIYEIQFSRPSS